MTANVRGSLGFVNDSPPDKLISKVYRYSLGSFSEKGMQYSAVLLLNSLRRQSTVAMLVAGTIQQSISRHRSQYLVMFKDADDDFYFLELQTVFVSHVLQQIFRCKLKPRGSYRITKVLRFGILPGTSEYDCGPVTVAPISAPVPGLAKLFFISSSPPVSEAMAE